MRLVGDRFIHTWQGNRDNCFPTAIKVILDGLSIEHQKPELKLAVKKIGKICGYAEGVDGNPLEALDGLNAKHLRNKGYIIKNAVAVDMAFIKSILDNNNYSAPIVTVDQAYFQEDSKNYNVISNLQVAGWWHQLVVTDILESEGKIEIFDPYKRYSMPRDANVKSTLSVPKFINYWKNTQNDIFWIERILSGRSSLHGVQRNLKE